MRTMASVVLVLAAMADRGQAQAASPGQGTGRVAGQVVDAGTGTPIAEAAVQITDAVVGGRTGIDGRFSIASVPAGTVSLTVRRLGFAAKTVTGIVVPAGGVVEQNVALEATAVMLAAQVVTASAERGTVREALNSQRTATQIVNSITAEQIARSPDGDAAAAVSRVSGVTVRGGKYVFVRGLGERYTVTSLNGARMPSPEPEKREVPLDIFPAGLVQSITTAKTFTPDQPGDFGGGAVNIQTREFPLRRTLSYSLSTGGNAAAIATLPSAAPEKLDWLGVGGTERALPGLVRAGGDFSGVSQGYMNRAIRSFRNVWTPGSGTGTPSAGATVFAGGQAPVGRSGKRVGYVLSGSYARTQEVRRDETIASAIPTSEGDTRAYSVFSGQSGSVGVLWGGLVNLSALVTPRTRLALNNSYNRSADRSATELLGIREDFSLPTRRSLLDFVSRSVRSNQLRVEQVVGSRQRIALSVTSSAVSRSEPDRTEVQYVREQDASGQLLPYALFSYNPDGARKTFAALRERSLSARLDYQLAFLKVGAVMRRTDRTADNFSYSVLSRSMPREVREQPPEVLFRGPYVADTAAAFYLMQNSTGGSYTARDRLAAGYAMVDAAPRSWLKVIAGARVERSAVRVQSASILGEQTDARLTTTDVLPSLALTVALTDAQNLRLSAAQTLARPEYRELSPLTYRDVLAQRDIFGNPALERTRIQNYDLRWEWYPRPGEIVSLGGFAKRFTSPIEQVDVATSGASQLSFVNAAGARTYGFETEIRLGLDRVAGALTPVSVFGNATIMRSRIDLSNDRISALTNRIRPMVGQAPYVFNAGATWQGGSRRTSGTMLFNIVGRRILAAGVTPLPDTYEQPRGVLDVSLRVAVLPTAAVKLDARNLLDAPYEVTQGSVVRNRYRLGRVFSLGMSWQP